MSPIPGSPPAPRPQAGVQEDILNVEVPSSEEDLPVRQPPKAKAKPKANNRAPRAQAEGDITGTPDSNVAVQPRGSKRAAPAKQGGPNKSDEAASGGGDANSHQEPAPGKDGVKSETSIQQQIHRTSSNLYKKQKLLDAAPNDKALLAQVATLTADLNALKQKRKATASANPEAQASTAGSTHEDVNNEGQLEPKPQTKQSAHPWFLSNMVSDVLLMGDLFGKPVIMRTCVWGPHIAFTVHANSAPTVITLRTAAVQAPVGAYEELCSAFKHRALCAVMSTSTFYCFLAIVLVHD